MAPDPQPCPSRSVAACPMAPGQHQHSAPSTALIARHGGERGLNGTSAAKLLHRPWKKKIKIRAQCMAVYEEQLNPSQLHGKRQVY